MNEIPEWLVALRGAERDEHGLTEAQREGADLTLESISLDWRPRILYLASKLGISELEALAYSRLLIEQRLLISQQNHAVLTQERVDKVTRLMEQELDEGEDWKPEGA